jgi:hypothetical protein
MTSTPIEEPKAKPLLGEGPNKDFLLCIGCNIHKIHSNTSLGYAVELNTYLKDY